MDAGWTLASALQPTDGDLQVLTVAKRSREQALKTGPELQAIRVGMKIQSHADGDFGAGQAQPSKRDYSASPIQGDFGVETRAASRASGRKKADRFVVP
jgi:hypothetical protein